MVTPAILIVPFRLCGLTTASAAGLAGLAHPLPCAQVMERRLHLRPRERNALTSPKRDRERIRLASVSSDVDIRVRGAVLPDEGDR